MNLTNEHLDRFTTDGYVVVEGALSDADIDLVISDYETVVDDLVAAQNLILRQRRRDALARYFLAAEEVYPTWGATDIEQERAVAEIARVASREDLEPTVIQRWVEAFYLYREGPPVQGDGANPSVVFQILSLIHI